MSLLFPQKIRSAFCQPGWTKGLEEIRVRVGQPMCFLYSKGEFYLQQRGSHFLFTDKMHPDLYITSGEDVAEMLNYISNYSLYAYREEIRQGYITIEGGHRIGVAGQAAVSEGKLTGLFHIAFLNIRVAHERPGCAKKVLPMLRHHNGIYNTLILSAPGAGKTTLLRDSIKSLSEGEKDVGGLKVCVVDERSEIAACYHGVPQNNLGPRTDVLDGCGKAEGMLMLIRSMSPQVVAVDELGNERDFFAVEQTVNSGSSVLGTIHAGSVRELSEKPYLRKWMERELFKRFVLIEKESDGSRRISIYDQHMEKLC